MGWRWSRIYGNVDGRRRPDGGRKREGREQARKKRLDGGQWSFQIRTGHEFAVLVVFGRPLGDVDSAFDGHLTCVLALRPPLAPTRRRFVRNAHDRWARARRHPKGRNRQTQQPTPRFFEHGRRGLDVLTLTAVVVRGKDEHARWRSKGKGHGYADDTSCNARTRGVAHHLTSPPGSNSRSLPSHCLRARNMGALA